MRALHILDNHERIRQQRLREQIVIFYEQYRFSGNEDDEHQLFTSHDKKEALDFFDGENEDISFEELLLRRNRSVLMLERTKSWAQEYKKAFINDLYALDIALDRKKALKKEFCASSFQHKATLYALVKRERHRIEEKKLAQIAEREEYKTQFYAFFTTHSQYFCYEDRISAWNNVVSSLATFRTHRGKMNRLQALFTMLPSNLAYARALDERYQNLLRERVSEEWRKEACLETFRLCRFEFKLKRIAELEQSPTIKEQKALQTKALENSREKKENIQLYTTLYALNPHGISPDEFAKLEISEQKAALQKKITDNNDAQELITQLTQNNDVTTEELGSFRQLTLTEKKAYLIQRAAKKIVTVHTEAVANDTEPSIHTIRPLRICAIAIKILRNQERKEFANDKDRVKMIQDTMQTEGVTGNFTLDHLNYLRDIAANLAQDEWESTRGLQWIEARLRERVYLGEGVHHTRHSLRTYQTHRAA